MNKTTFRYVACAVTIAAALSTPLLHAQPASPQGIQAAFAKDAGTLSDKFTGLARVMAGKYEYRPGQGVRSVGDVFNLIVAENGMLAAVLSGTPPGPRSAPITDPAALEETLKTSYANLQKVIS